MTPSVDPTFVGEERQHRLRHLVDTYTAVTRTGQSRLVVLTAPTGWGKTRIVRELYATLAGSADGAYWPPHLDAGEGSWLQARKRVFPAPFDVGENASIPYLWLGVSCQRDQMGRELSTLQYAEQQFQAHVGPLAATLDSKGERWKARLTALGAVAGLLGLPDPVNMAMTWHGVATSGWEMVTGEWRHYSDRRAGAKARRVETHHGAGSAERAAELAEQLARLSGEDLPVVLVLDDAHWADPGTVGLVGKLLNTPGHVLVVATAWPDQLAVQAAEAGTFGHALRAWMEVGRAERHDLSRLPDAALVQVIEDAGSDVDPRVLRALCERADGNPNRLQGLMSLRVVRRALAAGGSSLTEGQIDALPAGDSEIIMAIWRDLPEHVREVLALSTLQGSEFNPDWIPAAAGLLDLADAETGLAQAQSPWGWVRSLDAALAVFIEAGLFERAEEESRTLFLPDELAQARAAMLQWAADQKRSPGWDALSGAARRAVLEAHFLGADQGFLAIDADVVDSAHRLLGHLEEGEELGRWREVAERGVEWTQGKPELQELSWTFERKLADAIGAQGDYSGALDRYRTLLRDHTRAVGPNEDAHLELRYGHAWLLIVTGDAEAAVTELEEILETWTARYGDRHEATLRARRRRAMALLHADHAGEALAEFERVIELLAESGADEGDVLLVRSWRASALGQSWRAGDAVSELEAVLEAETRRVGRDHPVTLHVRNDLGHWLMMVRGRADDARVILENLVADRLQILGADNPDTLTTRGNLASAYANLGETARAITQYRQLLADQQRVLGPDHPSTLATQSNLAFTLQEAGHAEEALVVDRELLATQERALGNEAAPTVRTRLNVALLLAETGRNEEAIVLLEFLTDIVPRVFGWGHLLTPKTYLRLAGLLGDTGRQAEGREILDKLVDGRAANLGSTHVDTLRARLARATWMSDRARMARSPQRVREALAEIRRVILEHEGVLGERHPLTQKAQEVETEALEALRSEGWDQEAGDFR